jgi:hypothetical protein
MEAAQCRNEARRVTAGDNGPFAAQAIVNAYHDCMLGKGWES